MNNIDVESKVTDFDFLEGRWKVHQRRLKERLVGCTEWEEFAGSSQLSRLMDGRANVDDNLLELPGGHYRAVTLHSFDPTIGPWSIWWLDGRHPHRIDLPMIGGFSRGVGIFHADEVIDGKPVRVRFLWSDITATSCQWQQAFSADGGETWETNWIMDFTRMCCV